MSNEWNSKRIIGNVKERFEQLKRKEYDFRSFYNGWIEGRFNMCNETKNTDIHKDLNDIKTYLVVIFIALAVADICILLII